MEICDHGIDKSACPLCRRVAAKIEPSQPIVTAPAPAAEPVRIPNTDAPKEITDPVAKSVLQLAEEYAAAQDEFATIRDAVRNTESVLKGLRAELVAAERLCAEKQEALHAAVTPAVLKERKPRQKKETVVEVIGGERIGG